MPYAYMDWEEDERPCEPSMPPETMRRSKKLERLFERLGQATQLNSNYVGGIQASIAGLDALGVGGTKNLPPACRGSVLAPNLAFLIAMRHDLDGRDSVSRAHAR